MSEWKFELCPYCGSDDVFLDGCEGDWQVCCGNCGAYTPGDGKAAEVVSDWNRHSREKWAGLRAHRKMMAG